VTKAVRQRSAWKSDTALAPHMVDYLARRLGIATDE